MDIILNSYGPASYYKGNYAQYLEDYQLLLKTRNNEWKKIESIVK